MPGLYPPYPDQGRLRFLRVRDFGDLINVTFAFLRENGRLLVRSQLVIVGPALVLLAVVLGVFADRLGVFFGTPSATSPEDFETLGAEMGAAVPAFLVVMAAYVVSALVSYTAVFGLVSLYRHGEAADATTADVWAETSRFLGAAAGVFGFGLLLVVLAVPVLLIPCLGALAVLAAFVYFYPAIQLLWPTRVFEADGVFEAFTRSRELAKTNWGRAFGTLFVGAILAVVAGMILTLPGAVVSGVLGGPDGPTALGTAVGTGLQLLGGLVSNVITAVLVCFLHGSLKAEAEGADLDDDLDALAREAGLGGPSHRASDPDGPALPSDDPPPPDEGEGPAPGGFRGGGFRS